MRRRSFLAWVGAIVLAPARAARADDVNVPVDLQVQLLDRVTRYERRWPSEREPARVLVVRASGAVAARTATQLASELARARSLGGRPAEASIHAFSTVAALATAVREERSHVVYLTPGLSSHVAGIAAALEGLRVLTVASVGAYVALGAVVGFELAAARPRIVVNLGRARAQDMAFNPQFLRLTRVVP